MTAKKAIPLRKATAEEDNTVLFLKRSKGITGSRDLRSTTMKATKSAAAPANVRYSCHEYHGYVVPPSRKPRISNVTQAVRVETPRMSIEGFALAFLDSLTPNQMSANEAIPSGRLM